MDAFLAMEPILMSMQKIAETSKSDTVEVDGNKAKSPELSLRGNARMVGGNGQTAWCYCNFQCFQAE